MSTERLLRDLEERAFYGPPGKRQVYQVGELCRKYDLGVDILAKISGISTAITLRLDEKPAVLIVTPQPLACTRFGISNSTISGVPLNNVSNGAAGGRQESQDEQDRISLKHSLRRNTMTSRCQSRN